VKRVAVPMEAGQVCPHFGHAPQFVIFDVDPASKQVVGETVVDAPPHQPGMRPGWVAEQGANVILAGGMGSRAQELFMAAGVEVVTGVNAATPRAAAEAYARNTLESTGGVCDQHDGGCH